MTIRVYEPTAKFGELTSDYHDYECDTYQVYNGVLQLMRYGKQDIFIPLSSIKLFQDIAPKTFMLPYGTVMDSVVNENGKLLPDLPKGEATNV